MTFFVQAMLAFLLTALMILWMRRPAHRFGLVDDPGGRKRHGAAVPVTGGIAMTVGFFLALALSLPALSRQLVLLVSMAVLALIGVLDDVGEVSPRSKLGVQVLAAVLMTSWANHFLIHLGDLFGRGDILLMNWGIPLTVFATVALINGINMLDGLDGLAGGLVFVVLCFFAGFARWAGDAASLKILVVLLGALGGFLLFNLPHRWRGHRRTFMGDTGSLVLGFVVAWYSIGLTQGYSQTVPPVVMLWVTGVVLFDLFTVTVRRILRRRDPAAPDRAHIHHILLRRGLSPARAVALLLGVNLALGLIGTLGWAVGVPETWLFASYVAVALGYVGMFLFPARLLRRKRAVAAGTGTPGSGS
jgi:UDP-GlcNAc:undecaprenyl-phosphate/decaprenyl-phosphate GlcNAc-1-phosphate transferase